MAGFFDQGVYWWWVPALGTGHGGWMLGGLSVHGLQEKSGSASMQVAWFLQLWSADTPPRYMVVRKGERPSPSQGAAQLQAWAERWLAARPKSSGGRTTEPPPDAFPLPPPGLDPHEAQLLAPSGRALVMSSRKVVGGEAPGLRWDEARHPRVVYAASQTSRAIPPAVVGGCRRMQASQGGWTETWVGNKNIAGACGGGSACDLVIRGASRSTLTTQWSAAQWAEVLTVLSERPCVPAMPPPLPPASRRPAAPAG